ncbi:MAG: hypothetical protein JRJ87_23000 [Deltaproteobacteria bacterium]|nr:hypothetical protein [Deltaproteobacteria bacterium]
MKDHSRVEKSVLSFRVCDLDLEVLFTHELARVVNHVVEPFVCNAKGRYSILLNYKAAVGRSKATRPKTNIINANSDICEIRKWQKNSLEIDLFENTPLAVSISIAYLLISALSYHHGLLLHGAMLVRDSKAHILVGRSGAGKSTLAKNAANMQCAHDDNVAVRYRQGCWYAYGIPTLDNAGLPGRNMCAPIEVVYLIEKSDSFQIVDLPTRLFLAGLPGSVIMPYTDPAMTINVAESLLTFATGIECRRLLFREDSDLGSQI